MGSAFTPYSTNGYWVLTDEGWTWISDYSWGWAPFHYGRWYNDPSVGYVWVPGYEWGPGWVSWRRSDDYYGWAPIGPGVNISVAYSNDYNLPYNQWNFVRCRDFGRRNLNNYYINRSNNVTIINNTTVINNTRVDARNTTFNPGPDRAEVQHHAGRPITPVAIQDQSRPVQHINSNALQLYRPQVEHNPTTTINPVPRKVTPLNEVKPMGSIPRVKNQLVKDQNLQPAQTSTGNVKPRVRQPIAVDENPTAPAPNQPVRQPINNIPISPRVKQLPVQQPVRRPVTEEQLSPRVSPQPRVQEQQPVRQPEPVHEPVREQRLQPEQNINRAPVRQEPVRQQQIRPAPVQRPAPAMPAGGRKN